MKYKEFIPLGLILILAVFLRVLWLDRVPGAIAGDELTYILPIKSVVLSGQDFSFHWNILKSLFFSYPTTLPQAELPYFLLYPAVGYLPMNLFTTTITYALLSAATAFAMFLFVGKLLNRKAGLIAALVVSVNPWQIFTGRTVYETVPAALFFILTLYFLINERGKRIFIAAPFAALAFYSYIGTKIVFLPIIFAVSFFAYFENKNLPAGRQGKFGREILAVNIFCILLVLFFSFETLRAPNRASEIALPSDPSIAKQVNVLRKNSIAPNSVTNIFVNKYTVYTEVMTTKMLGAFSPGYLFISGDNFTSLYGHGMFYAVDALFFILGLAYLVKRGRSFVLVLSLIFLATLPHVLHTTSTDIFTPHLALFMTFLIIPIAFGISEVLELFKSKLVLFVVILIYIVSASNFFYVYFFQYPLAGNYDFPARLAARYILLASNTKKTNVYVSGLDDFYKKYVYYTNSLNSKNFAQIKNSVNSKKYKLGNINFYPCGDVLKTLDPRAVTIYQSSICEPFALEGKDEKISRLDDGGEIYKIYGDQICRNYGLSGYPSNLKISDFSVENLSTQKFCETFISR